ncbi:F0F1 ATP synthase subunit epsilon [Alphaproteobacteria bacterium KMM 3653]|uniref:ATP synthase epsilon chain n=1 Tax=Harenicola maris TaxID=2841044 RepID=A0AAP2G939_9RHOB|nr:F0F1 ATP synthase subunit epsilon [Harenicola maris]
MADTMQFDLVAPERRLASLQASEVRIPGSEGDLTAMPDHAPLITTLRPGVLTVVGPEGEQKYVVTGGFAEISAEGTSVLAERAVPVAEMTGELMDEMIAEATSAVEEASADMRDALAKTAADFSSLRDVINV